MAPSAISPTTRTRIISLAETPISILHNGHIMHRPTLLCVFFSLHPLGDPQYSPEELIHHQELGKQSACTLQFSVPKALGSPVFLYYKLTNFYQVNIVARFLFIERRLDIHTWAFPQNHRRYVKSLDTDQMKGQARTGSDIQGNECKPVDIEPSSGLPYYPCGLIANSMFNDTFDAPVLIAPAGGGAPIRYNMTERGISWPGEALKYAKSSYTVDQCIPPPLWIERFPTGRYTDANPIPDLSQDEHFQVWMRTAGLSTFRKLFARNDNETMQPGRYQIVAYPSLSPLSLSLFSLC
jgi:hypothetical protein